MSFAALLHAGCTTPVARLATIDLTLCKGRVALAALRWLDLQPQAGELAGGGVAGGYGNVD